MKRIATVQDLSCIGRCSLTIALPVLSCMGLETAVVPTAVLSTHTACEGYTFRDLAGDIPGILDHWMRQGFALDTVYSGYLGNAQQTELVSRMFREFQPEHRIVDPVMGDHGRLYSGIAEDFPEQMKRLCAEAEVILPNQTECALMTGLPYHEDASMEERREMLRTLGRCGCRHAILTGVSDGTDGVGALCYDAFEDSFYEYYNEKMPVSYHGTGDLFASTFAGAMTLGMDVKAAARTAVDFTLECIRITMKESTDPRTGVCFERALPMLVMRGERE